jgi:hypothetical protein
MAAVLTSMLLGVLPVSVVLLVILVMVVMVVQIAALLEVMAVMVLAAALVAAVAAGELTTLGLAVVSVYTEKAQMVLEGKAAREMPLALQVGDQEAEAALGAAL